MFICDTLRSGGGFVFEIQLPLKVSNMDTTSPIRINKHVHPSFQAIKIIIVVDLLINMLVVISVQSFLEFLVVNAPHKHYIAVLMIIPPIMIGILIFGLIASLQESYKLLITSAGLIALLGLCIMVGTMFYMTGFAVSLGLISGIMIWFACLIKEKETVTSSAPTNLTI